MFAKAICFFFCLTVILKTNAQDSIRSFRFRSDVLVTVDRPMKFNPNKTTHVIFYALPNGNTTAQTMGKRLKEGDDWHFDIQHIKAQTAFIRSQSKENFIVVYLENDLKAWPQWKRKYDDRTSRIQALTDTILQILHLRKFKLHLNGHSGGGSFIFGFLDGVKNIPAYIERITFIDSNYGYDSSYTDKILRWLQTDKQKHLTVFAYNDSIALYNGKSVVSATGGTWYRSKLMMRDLSAMKFTCKEDSVSHCFSKNKQVNIFLKQNPDRLIFHTQQVELNGFIHSVFLGTGKENVGYSYYGPRAYTGFIE